MLSSNLFWPGDFDRQRRLSDKESPRPLETYKGYVSQIVAGNTPALEVGYRVGLIAA